jgi:CRP/FNR family transcriptional regulator
MEGICRLSGHAGGRIAPSFTEWREFQQGGHRPDGFREGLYSIATVNRCIMSTKRGAEDVAKMTATAQQHSWIDRFQGLSRLEPRLRDVLTSRAQVIRVPADTVIFGPGKSPENMLLLLEGTVRVQQLAENGREVVLYRVTAGESCVLTTACMLAYEDYAAEGVAETDIVAAAIPRSVFDDLVATSKEFRTFVFSAYSRRITDLFHVIEDIAFRRMDIRLAQKILDRAEGGELHATHAQLAAELGTAREVISRQLAEFQRRGWVSLGRGTVTVEDAAALRKLSDS